MKLDGFGLFVEDMPRMIRFYRDVLGFEIQESAVSVWHWKRNCGGNAPATSPTLKAI